jgi:hypothetical protein
MALTRLPVSERGYRLVKLVYDATIGRVPQIPDVKHYR